MAIEISPTLDNIFHLPSILKIVDIIESEPGLTQSSIIEKTQLGRGTVEDYRKWGIFSGLITQDNTLTSFGKYRYEILYECDEKLFSEIAHYFLIQNSSLYSIMILQGYHKYKINGHRNFEIEELIQWVSEASPGEKAQYKHFKSTLLNQINSLNDQNGIPLKLIRKSTDEKNKYNFQTYFPSKECIYFCINYNAHRKYKSGKSSLFVNPSEILSNYNSLKNIYICPDNYIEGILSEFRSKGIITYEKAADLNQIGIHTKFKDEEDIYKALLEGI